MIDFEKYDFNEEDLHFIHMIKMDIQNQNEIYLQYKEHSFCIEPSGDELTFIDDNRTLTEYRDFDDLFLNCKIDGKPLIELVKDLDFGD